jgi:hypothetical protein
MPEDLLNILKDSNRDIDNQKLMDYIQGKLSAEEKHEVEKWMIDEPFFGEAAEGLQQIDSNTNVEASVEQINKQLLQYLRQKRNKKRKRKGLTDNFWVYIAIIVILLIAIFTWLVVSKLNS